MSPRQPTNDIRENDPEIIPPHLAVKAMRDSGYKNTAYALAELIDNSVQAGATCVDVVCVEKTQIVQERHRRRIEQIAVIDNGSGMSADVLRVALQFGNGMHLNDRDGIGRFGMGLPNSSISQCRRVDVWTWQNGADNAIHSYLDVDEIEQATLNKVPRPRHKALPKMMREYSSDIGDTGTVVVWSRFDEHRLTWRGAKATLQNTGALIGRMYRHFLNSGKLGIRLVTDSEGVQTATEARPNDPLYLMKKTCTPPPFESSPMFQKWGERDYHHHIQWDGKKHRVDVRMSWARPETVPEDGTDRGGKDYGKHAAKNVGVSIVRAGRELDLDAGWANKYDPRERWWGVEVTFPPGLDEVFGVPNNKQAASVFSAMAQFDWTLEAEDGETYTEVKERLRDSGDPRAELIEIADYIRDQLALVRKEIQNQTKGSRPGRSRHETPGVEDRATDRFKKRAEEGYKTPEDDQKFGKEEKKQLVRDLVDRKNYSERSAREIADGVEKRGKRVIFVEAELDGFAFFKVDQQPGGLTEIVFNTEHPAYEQLVKVLDANVDEATDRDLVHRIQNASDTFRMLFAAWARYEMEDVPNRARLNTMRQEWGKMAQVFLQQSDE